MNDNDFMALAIAQAEIALQAGDYPIGAVVVLDGQVVGTGRNQVVSSRNRIAHAEISAINNSQKVLAERSNARKAILYTTYEPCPMCFGAFIQSGIYRLVYGTNLDGSGATGMLKHFPELYRGDRFRCEVVSGILERECREVFLKGDIAKSLRKSGKLRL